jgi:hypothetical protein
MLIRMSEEAGSQDLFTDATKGRGGAVVVNARCRIERQGG